MEYEDLNKDDFDAVVTGELTHCALHLEEELNKFITLFFNVPNDRSNQFKQLILLRDGLNFQDKIEISRAILPLLDTQKFTSEFKKKLKSIEDFKSWRNAMAHGIDVSEENDWEINLKITIQVTSRSGKNKEIVITPQSHKKMYDETYLLLENIQKIIDEIFPDK